MLLIGFKSNWAEDLARTRQYFNVLEAAFDHSYSVGILRVRSGLDFSGQINAVETEDVDEERSSQSGEEEEEDSSNSDSIKETEEKLDIVPEMMKMTRTRTRTRTISKTIYTDRGEVGHRAGDDEDDEDEDP